MFRVEENSGRKGAENQTEDVEENQRNTVSTKPREEHFEKSKQLTVTCFGNNNRKYPPGEHFQMPQQTSTTTDYI